MSNIKIYIPNRKYFWKKNRVGGPTTFFRNLKEYLNSNNIRYCHYPFNAKGIFFAVSFNKLFLKIFKLLGRKIIQRLDGVYYPSQHGPEFVILNSDIRDIYLNYADFIIFQSEYSKKQCFEMLGKIKSDNYKIIYNGANKKIFYPNKERKISLDKIRFVVSGSFRKGIMIEPIIMALDDLEKDGYTFELLIIGPILDKNLMDFVDRDYVVHKIAKDQIDLANMLRESDIFIHSQLNDNCPNSVIEALSCGLPVVGFDSGAMKELLFFNRDLLAEVNDNLFHKSEDFNYLLLLKNIKLVINNYSFYRGRSLDNNLSFDMNDCGMEYVDVFKKQLSI